MLLSIPQEAPGLESPWAEEALEAEFLSFGIIPVMVTSFFHKNCGIDSTALFFFSCFGWKISNLARFQELLLLHGACHLYHE